LPDKINLLGVAVTLFLYGLYILLFAFRLLGRSQVGHLIASSQFLAVLPLGYLFLTAPHFDRPAIYYVQIGLMMFFLAVELVLDYVLKTDFRHVRWIVISYVTLFFASTGGMLGIAANSGRGWTILSVILFFSMAALAFIQRAVTGM
jgi:hypothetical protein